MSKIMRDEPETDTLHTAFGPLTIRPQPFDPEETQQAFTVEGTLDVFGILVRINNALFEKSAHRDPWESGFGDSWGTTLAVTNSFNVEGSEEKKEVRDAVLSVILQAFQHRDADVALYFAIARGGIGSLAVKP